MTATGYRGSWHADHRSMLIRFSPEAGLALPVIYGELQAPIPLRRFDEFLHPDDRAWIQDRRANLNARGPVRTVIEYRIVGRDGVRWLQAQSLRRGDINGRPIDGRGMIFDITDLKEAGDGVARNLVAPLSEPLNHLAEGVALALVAAEQARLPGLASKLRRLAYTTGRLLAGDLMLNRHPLQ